MLPSHLHPNYLLVTCTCFFFTFLIQMGFLLIKVNIETRRSFIYFLKLVRFPSAKYKLHIKKTKSRNPVYYQRHPKSCPNPNQSIWCKFPPFMYSDIPHLIPSSLYCSGLRNLFIFPQSRATEVKSFLLYQNNWLAKNKAVILLFPYPIGDSVFLSSDI